jgi:hypothetical protein
VIGIGHRREDPQAIGAAVERETAVGAVDVHARRLPPGGAVHVKFS